VGAIGAIGARTRTRGRTCRLRWEVWGTRGLAGGLLHAWWMGSVCRVLLRVISSGNYIVVCSLSPREDLVSICMESGYDADVLSGWMVGALP